MFVLLLVPLFFAQSSVQANMIVDMAVMLGGQMGASMANQTISAMYTNMGNAIAKDQNNIITANQAFQKYVQNAGQAELKTIFKIFKTAQKHMGTLTAEQADFMNQMETYILQAISLNAPQSDYIEDGPSADELFTLGTMYTPKGQIWKNIFPVGNWEYDETTDSFWQMYNSPLMQIDPTTQIASADKAPNNSIFTEWTTRQPSYEISCELTLYQVSYPFFVGVIFNKARWISGDNNRLQKYRLLGVYGDSNTSIQVSYSEQYTPAAAKTKGTTPATTPTTLYPLQQIINNQTSAQQKAILNPNAFSTLPLQPITFKIKIITSPTTIQYKIWQATKNSKEPQNYVTVKSKDSSLYLYHGIGFIAPGAIAQFKIIKPKEILFSTAAQKTFTAQVQTLITETLLAKGATS